MVGKNVFSSHLKIWMNIQQNCGVKVLRTCKVTICKVIKIKWQ